MKEKTPTESAWVSWPLVTVPKLPSKNSCRELGASQGIYCCPFNAIILFILGGCWRGRSSFPSTLGRRELRILVEFVPVRMWIGNTGQKSTEVTSKNCSFVPLFPEIRWRGVIFAPCFHLGGFHADCSQNIPILGANLSFLWDNDSSLTPCRSLLRRGQHPAPAAGSCNFSTRLQRLLDCFALSQRPKIIQTLLPSGCLCGTSSSRSKQSNPGGRGGVFSFQRNFQGQPQAPGSPGALAVVTGVTPR